MHPNVLAIHQVHPNGRLPFLVMPLVAGESLAQRLTAQGRLELKEILRIGMQAAAGLAAAHEQGLVHRDVKPANILLEKGVERALLTDFGLARAADDVVDDPLGDHRGHAAIHVARAGEGRTAGRPLGSLQFGLRAIRDGDGRFAVSRRLDAGHPAAADR